MNVAATTTSSLDSSDKDRGEPDWSLEDVDCVLHWIAGGTISERKGTELLNAIFGKSLSRYTVRSKVRALKEKERVSTTTNIELKESDDNDNESHYRIVEVESENGDVKTYTELMNCSASCSDVAHENGDTLWSTDVYDLSTKEEADISKVEITRLLNRRGNLGLIAIAENDGYRVYRQSTKQATRVYYRCSRCDWLKKKNGSGRTAYITMVNDTIVGTAYPLHNELCHLYSPSALRMKQFDREAKKQVLKNVKDDKELKQPIITKERGVSSCEHNRCFELNGRLKKDISCRVKSKENASDMH